MIFVSRIEIESKRYNCPWFPLLYSLSRLMRVIARACIGTHMEPKLHAIDCTDESDIRLLFLTFLELFSSAKYLKCCFQRPVNIGSQDNCFALFKFHSIFICPLFTCVSPEIAKSKGNKIELRSSSRMGNRSSLVIRSRKRMERSL